MTNETLAILSIVCGSLSILVGFLLLFLQFYPQRKRRLLQALMIKRMEYDEIKKKEIDKLIKKVEKPDVVVFKITINKLNFLVFFYAITILTFSLILVMYYLFLGELPEFLVYILIGLTIIGYWLLIPVVKYSYIETRYASERDEEKS